MKYPKLFGVFLGVNGSTLLAEMTSAEREGRILGMIGATRTEVFYPRKKFAGHEVAIVANAYALKGSGHRNDIASYMCGGDVFGNVVVLRVNGDGFKCLMTLKNARKIMEDIQDVYYFG